MRGWRGREMEPVDSEREEVVSTMRFEKMLVSREPYEAAAVCDVDRDGILDIVSGSWWYRGPDFRQRFPLDELTKVGETWDDFSAIPIDVNGDGFLDVIKCGWFSGDLVWLENPRGQWDKCWQRHMIAQCGHIETVRAWDIDGDGDVEIVPNTPEGPLRAFKLKKDGAGRGRGEFTELVLWEGRCGHGLGFGDMNGDGRGDIVLSRGWLERRAHDSGLWAFHAGPDLGLASVEIVVADVDNDGIVEVVSGYAHDYGLYYWKPEGGDVYGDRWHRVAVDPYCSQYHDVQWHDIDGDGRGEIVTGKRYMAHDGGRDPGSYDPVGLYSFKWSGEGLVKEVIDFGEPDCASGCGIQFAVADLEGMGALSIVAPGKEGLYVFRNTGLLD